jgi:hypothetical protein
MFRKKTPSDKKGARSRKASAPSEKKPGQPRRPYIRPPLKHSHVFHEVRVLVADDRWKLVEEWAEEDGLTPKALIQSWVSSMFSRRRRK